MKKHPCITGRVRSYEALQKDQRLWDHGVLLEVVKGTVAGPKRVRVLMVAKSTVAAYEEQGRLRRTNDPRLLMVDYIDDPRRLHYTMFAAG